MKLAAAATHSFSLGNFSVPRKSMCSQKCASPGSSAGSLNCPTFTSSAAAALSLCVSLTRTTFSWFGSTTPRYSRESFGDVSTLNVGNDGRAPSAVAAAAVEDAAAAAAASAVEAAAAAAAAAAEGVDKDEDIFWDRDKGAGRARRTVRARKEGSARRFLSGRNQSLERNNSREKGRRSRSTLSRRAVYTQLDLVVVARVGGSRE